MNIETLKLPVSELTLGMHVVRLDRPWLETPFKLQGFKISKPSELRQLAQYCRFVYIDVERGVLPPRGKGERVTLTPTGDFAGTEGFIPIAASGTLEKNAKVLARLAAQSELPAAAADYPLVADFAEELPRALAAAAAAKAAMREFMQALKGNPAADLGAVKQGAAALEESILRHPDPLLLVRALASDEAFSLRHCVNSTILAVALGRELGLKRQVIHELAMGVLLADIGKLRLPKELLRTTRRLNRQETEVIKLHVKYGVEMARDLGGLTPGTIDIIGSHHERFNGSGYPAGLRGGEIPLVVRIAGLVDSFDAITSERTYSAAIPLHEAVQELYAATVDLFQRELVAKLIQVLGTYPVGSLVALSDDSIALVVAQNRQRRLFPRVIRLTDAAQRPLAGRAELDLASAVPSLTVKEILDPGSRGIDRPTGALLGV